MERGRSEKRKRSPRTSRRTHSGSLSPQGASSGSRSPEEPRHCPPQFTDSLDQSKKHHTLTNKSPKDDELMSDRRSVSPQGASSGSSSPAASPAGRQSPPPSAIKDLSPQGVLATSPLANGGKDAASAHSRNHVESTADPPPNQQRSRYGIKIINLDLKMSLYHMERKLRKQFAHYGKVLSFAFHGKSNDRFCLLSYEHERERNNALAAGGLEGSLHAIPWNSSRDPAFFQPKGFGIKITNIDLGKSQDIIISTIKEEFKRFGDITNIRVVGDGEDRCVHLFYRHEYEQVAALSPANSFSAQFGALKVSPLKDVPERTDPQNIKFQEAKMGNQVNRHQMEPSRRLSSNLWRDSRQRSVIPASNRFQVTDVKKQSHNTNLSPFTRSKPSMSQSSSTNLPNMFNRTMDRNSTGHPYHRGVELRRSWSPNLNLPFNSQPISISYGTTIKVQPDLVMSRYRHEHGSALSASKPPNVYGKDENTTVQKSYGTLVRSGSSTSHHKESLTLWVNNLEDTTTKADVWTIFQPFGEIQHIEIREGFRNTGKQAFLQYLNLSSVYEAIQQMDGKYIGKAKLQLDFAYPKQPTNCVWIYGLYSFVNQSYLENIFRQFGPMVKLLHDTVKDSALVLYSDIASAVKAVHEINKKSIFGCQVTLGFANRRLQLGFCHSMESKGQNVGNFYQLVSETSEWLIRKANIERLLTLPS